ncbi:MAG TPA: hypothetical protein VLK57_17680 [Pseudonocardia sp.]|nr:hypothetical protein [Pseudonocardia sp.]
MIDDPSRSTVVAWYDTLPDDLAVLVEQVQASAGRLLGDAFTARDPAQVHATVIGLERAPAPFDLSPLVAHLRAALSTPWTIRFGGFPPRDRRLLSHGLSLHDRTFGVYGDSVVLVGWPVDGGAPRRTLADARLSCADLGVTHRYGDDPDVYLVVGKATGVVTRHVAPVRRDLALRGVDVALSFDDLSLVTYADPALPRASTTWRPL